LLAWYLPLLHQLNHSGIITPRQIDALWNLTVDNETAAPAFQQGRLDESRAETGLLG